MTVKANNAIKLTSNNPISITAIILAAVFALTPVTLVSLICLIIGKSSGFTVLCFILTLLAVIGLLALLILQMMRVTRYSDSYKQCKQAIDGLSTPVTRSLFDERIKSALMLRQQGLGTNMLFDDTEFMMLNKLINKGKALKHEYDLSSGPRKAVKTENNPYGFGNNQPSANGTNGYNSMMGQNTQYDTDESYDDDVVGKAYYERPTAQPIETQYSAQNPYTETQPSQLGSLDSLANMANTAEPQSTYISEADIAASRAHMLQGKEPDTYEIPEGANSFDAIRQGTTQTARANAANFKGYVQQPIDKELDPRVVQYAQETMAAYTRAKAELTEAENYYKQIVSVYKEKKQAVEELNAKMQQIVSYIREQRGS